MSLNRRISIRTRLIGGFIVVCVLMLGVLFIGLGTSREQQRLVHRTNELLVLTRNMGQVKYRISDISGWQLSYAWDATWMGGPTAVHESSPSRRAFEDSMSALDRELDAVQHGPVTAEEVRLLIEVRYLVAAYARVDRRIVEYFRQGTAAGTRQANTLILVNSYQTSRKIQHAVSKLVVSVSERSTKAQRRAQENARLGLRLQLSASAAALLLASVISFVIIRSIVASVRRIVASLEKLVEQESVPPLPDTGKDELSDIARAFNRTAELLRAARAEQRVLTDQLRELAFRDPLTGLLNRTEFLNRVDSGIARCRHTGEYVAALLADLDDFKPVNDRYGHAAGDVVLQEIADRLQKQVRNTDAVARLGGDEFAIFVEGGNTENFVASLTQRIDSAVRRPIVIHNELVSITVSIGIGLDRGGRLSAAELLEKADRTMYIEKRRRKDAAPRDPTEPLAYQLWRIDHNRGGW